MPVLVRWLSDSMAAVVGMAALVLVLACAAEATSPLTGKVAVVTGGSRGIGRGIAIELGRAGATVYVTGRPPRERPKFLAGSELDALTIERTAEDVTRAGGLGRALACDHSDDAAVERAFARIADENDGCIDILVNNAFSTEVARESVFRDSFWKQGMEMWDGVHGVGLRNHYLCSILAVPLMLRRGGGQIFHISSFGGTAYTFNVAYGVAKCALDRLASDMHVELRGTGISVVSLYPGLVQTEGNLELAREDKWASASGGLDLARGETPAFSGKAVVALCTASPEAQQAVSGSVQVVAELAREYGFDDEDGRQPPSIRSLQFLLPSYVFPKLRAEGVSVPRWLEDNVPDILLPWAVFRGGPPPAADDND